MSIIAYTVVLSIITTFASCERVRFDNYSLYKIIPEDDQHIRVLQDIQRTETGYDFWTDPVPAAEFVSVLTNPQEKSSLENILRQNNIKYSIPMKNIQEAIDKQKVTTYKTGSIHLSWDTYYNLDQIYNWLDDLVAAYPGVTTAISAGRSYQNRPIKGIKISHGPGRRAIFVEAGIHSREWISPSAGCFIINELLNSSDEETKAAAHDFDWYIFPVTNPDGYAWTHDHNRMWRKNRRPIRGIDIGVDLNRNWNNNWLVHGASTNPSTDTFAGLGPFSEPETRALSSYLISIGHQIDLYLSIHSFSQLLLVPFGNSTEPYANYYDAVNIGRRAMGALSVRYGTQYVTGNIAEAIYQATGGSVDWVKEYLKIPLVYCYELRDKGQYGFLLPEDQILPNNQEMMDSVLELIHQAKRFGYMNSGNGLGVSILMTVAALAITIFNYL